MFEQDIIRAEQELRDIRTAHNRGLGMISFSESSTTASQPASTTPAYYTAVATFSSDETFPPIIQFAAEDNASTQYGASPLTIGPPTFDSNALTATVNIVDYNEDDGNGNLPVPTVYAVSSIPIVSLTIVGTN